MRKQIVWLCRIHRTWPNTAYLNNMVIRKQFAWQWQKANSNMMKATNYPVDWSWDFFPWKKWNIISSFINNKKLMSFSTSNSIDLSITIYLLKSYILLLTREWPTQPSLFEIRWTWVSTQIPWTFSQATFMIWFSTHLWFSYA